MKKLLVVVLSLFVLTALFAGSATPVVAWEGDASFSLGVSADGVNVSGSGSLDLEVTLDETTELGATFELDLFGLTGTLESIEFSNDYFGVTYYPEAVFSNKFFAGSDWHAGAFNEYLKDQVVFTIPSIPGLSLIFVDQDLNASLTENWKASLKEEVVKSLELPEDFAYPVETVFSTATLDDSSATWFDDLFAVEYSKEFSNVDVSVLGVVYAVPAGDLAYDFDNPLTEGTLTVYYASSLIWPDQPASETWKTGTNTLLDDATEVETVDKLKVEVPEGTATYPGTKYEFGLQTNADAEFDFGTLSAYAVFGLTASGSPVFAFGNTFTGDYEFDSVTLNVLQYFDWNKDIDALAYESQDLTGYVSVMQNDVLEDTTKLTEFGLLKTANSLNAARKDFGVKLDAEFDASPIFVNGTVDFNIFDLEDATNIDMLVGLGADYDFLSLGVKMVWLDLVGASDEFALDTSLDLTFDMVTVSGGLYWDDVVNASDEYLASAKVVVTPLDELTLSAYVDYVAATEALEYGAAVDYEIDDYTVVGASFDFADDEFDWALYLNWEVEF